MPDKETFSTKKVRKSLFHFALGKVISGLIGLAMLIAMVRLLPATDYGAFVTFVALMEVSLLVSNLGVYPFAQRYITEAMAPRYQRFLPVLAWGSVGYRALTLALAVGALMLCASGVIAFFAIAAPVNALLLYGVAIFSEGMARYIDLAFDSLLEQARTQICILARNGTRLLLLLGACSLDFPIDIALVASIEALSATGGMIFSLFVLWGFLKPFSKDRNSESTSEMPFQLARLLRFSIPYYLAQCFTQVYSPDMIKLLISRLLGVLDAATFGFAHAISFVLQRYLPAQLLIGLIRPVIVSRQVGGANTDELTRLGNFVLKVNHFLLIPIIAYFVIVGVEFTAWLSKGKIADSSHVLVLLTALLLAQAVHIIFSTIAIALEDRRSVLIATIAAIPGVGFGVLFAQGYGPAGMAAGLWVSELLWCSVTWFLLSKQGFAFRIDWPAWLKLCLGGVMAGGLSHNVTGHLSGPAELLLAAVVLGTTYLVFCYLTKPFNDLERQSINKMLPRPLFVF